MLLTLLSALFFAGPATVPTSQSSVESDLRRIIANLQRQVSALREENADLKKKLAEQSAHASAGGPTPKTTYAQRAEIYIKHPGIGWSGNHPVPIEMSPQEAKQIRARAAEVDKKVRAYIEAHPMKDEFAQAMWAGNVIIGMRQEQLEIYGRLVVNREASLAKYCTFLPWQPQPGSQQAIYRIMMKGDEVLLIDRTDGEQSH